MSFPLPPAARRPIRELPDELVSQIAAGDEVVVGFDAARYATLFG